MQRIQEISAQQTFPDILLSLFSPDLSNRLAFHMFRSSALSSASTYATHIAPSLSLVTFKSSSVYVNSVHTSQSTQCIINTSHQYVCMYSCKVPSNAGTHKLAYVQKCVQYLYNYLLKTNVKVVVLLCGGEEKCTQGLREEI